MSVVRCLTFFMESAAWNQQQGPFDIFDRRADFDSCGTCSVLAARVACSARGSPRDTALRLKPKWRGLICTLLISFLARSWLRPPRRKTNY
jgi:hypothetical protein